MTDELPETKEHATRLRWVLSLCNLNDITVVLEPGEADITSIAETTEALPTIW